ncbi:MAG: hypothetical protein WCI36_04970 [bacterium]
MKEITKEDILQIFQDSIVDLRDEIKISISELRRDLMDIKDKINDIKITVDRIEKTLK